MSDQSNATPVAEVAKATRKVKQAPTVILAEESVEYAVVADAVRGRAEGSDQDFIRLNLHIIGSRGMKATTVFVSDKFYEKSLMGDVVSLVDGKIESHCIGKPVTVTLVRIPADGNTYGYRDRETGELVPFEKNDRVRLHAITGTSNDLVASMDVSQREAMYTAQKIAFIKERQLFELA